jgi:hypothetical protein
LVAVALEALLQVVPQEVPPLQTLVEGPLVEGPLVEGHQEAFLEVPSVVGPSSVHLEVVRALVELLNLVVAPKT